MSEFNEFVKESEDYDDITDPDSLLDIKKEQNPQSPSQKNVKTIYDLFQKPSNMFDDNALKKFQKENNILPNDINEVVDLLNNLGSSVNIKDIEKLGSEIYSNINVTKLGTGKKFSKYGINIEREKKRKIEEERSNRERKFIEQMEDDKKVLSNIEGNRIDFNVNLQQCEIEKQQYFKCGKDLWRKKKIISSDNIDYHTKINKYKENPDALVALKDYIVEETKRYEELITELKAKNKEYSLSNTDKIEQQFNIKKIEELTKAKNKLNSILAIRTNYLPEISVPDFFNNIFVDDEVRDAYSAINKKTLIDERNKYKEDLNTCLKEKGGQIKLDFGITKKLKRITTFKNFAYFILLATFLVFIGSFFIGMIRTALGEDTGFFLNFNQFLWMFLIMIFSIIGYYTIRYYFKKKSPEKVMILPVESKSLSEKKEQQTTKDIEYLSSSYDKEILDLKEKLKEKETRIEEEQKRHQKELEEQRNKIEKEIKESERKKLKVQLTQMENDYEKKENKLKQIKDQLNVSLLNLEQKEERDKQKELKEKKKNKSKIYFENIE